MVKSHASDLIDILDREFDLTGAINRQLTTSWTFADILAERASSRSRAAGSIRRGRQLEEEVEQIVRELGLPHDMRTRFTGQANRTAPCDLAIPGGDGEAQIVCGIKGFDSTGSKPTDATREVEEMASIRLPRQYVFVVVDGLGWLSRQADLRRIYRLHESNSIDGLYTRSTFSKFRTDLVRAATRLGLTGPGYDRRWAPRAPA